MTSNRRIKSRISKRRARAFQALAAKARMVSTSADTNTESTMLTKLLLAYGEQAREANEVLADQVAEQLQQSLNDIVDEMNSIEEEVKKVSGRVIKNNKIVPGSSGENKTSTYNNRANQPKLPSPSGRPRGKNLFTRVGKGLSGMAEKIGGAIDDDVEYAINSDPILLALNSIGKVSRKLGVFMSGKKKGFQPERDRQEEQKRKLREVESSREAGKSKADCPSYDDVKKAMRESLAEYFAQNPIKQGDGGSLVGDIIGDKITDKILKALGGAGAGLGSALGKGIDKVKETLGGAGKAVGGALDKVTGGRATGVLGKIGTVAKSAGKGIAKFGSRIIPFAGAAVGGGSAVLREMEGDHVGAGIDAAAAAASFVPVVGTAIAGGLVGVNMVRDYFNEDAAKNNEVSQDKRTSVGKIYEDKSGKPKLDNVRSALDTVSKEFDINRAEIYAVARQESSFNPNANKGNDKDAKGLFQFVKSTWNKLYDKFPELAAKYGIRAVNGNVDDRYDPMKSAIMYAYLRKEDIRAIGNLTSGNAATDSYLTHFLGGPSAKKVLAALKETPNDSIRAYVSDRAYQMNRASFDINGRPKTVKEFVDYIDKLMKGRIEKEQSEIAKVPPQIASLAPQESQAVPVSSVQGKDALKVGAGVDIDNLDPNLKGALQGAAAEYKQETGKSVNVTSGYRSVEKQAELYKQDPSKAAKPGSSLHNFGLAVDVSSADANRMDQLDILEKYGLERPLLHGKGRIRPEPWHIQPVGATKPSSPDSGPSERATPSGSIKDVSSRISQSPTPSEVAPQVLVVPQPQQAVPPQTPPNSRVPPSRSTPSSIQTAQAAENRRVL